MAFSLSQFRAAHPELSHLDTDTLAQEIYRNNPALAEKGVGYEDFLSQAGYDEDLQVSQPKKGTGRTLAGTAGDVLVSAGKGIVGLGGAAVGLLDLPTGGAVGKGLEKYTGYDLEATQRFLGSLYSDPQQEAFRKVAEAEGFTGKAKAMLQHPSTIAHSVIEALPSMGGGAAAARSAIGLLPKLSPLIAAAGGEGLIGAGSAAEQYRQESPNGTLSLKETGAAVGSGIGTGIFDFVGGSLAGKFGFDDINTMLASGKLTTGKTGKDVVKKIIGGGISEGAFKELPQSMQEQIWQNAALDKPLLEGVPEAGAQGLLIGAAMGGGANIPGAVSTVRQMRKKEEPPAPKPEQEEKQAKNLQYRLGQLERRAAYLKKNGQDATTVLEEHESVLRRIEALGKKRDIRSSMERQEANIGLEKPVAGIAKYNQASKVLGIEPTTPMVPAQMDYEISTDADPLLDEIDRTAGIEMPPETPTDKPKPLAPDEIVSGKDVESDYEEFKGLSFSELSKKSDELQIKIDDKHDELEADGIEFNRHDKNPEIKKLYRERIKFDTAAAAKGYEGARKIITDELGSGVPKSSLYASVDSILKENYSLSKNPAGVYMMSKYTGKALSDPAGTIKKLSTDISKLLFARDNPDADYFATMESSDSGLTRKGKEALLRESKLKAEKIHKDIMNFFFADEPIQTAKIKAKQIPQTKKQKATEEYHAFIDTLSDEQIQSAKDLIEESPASPAGQILKIKKALAKLEAIPSKPTDIKALKAEALSGPELDDLELGDVEAEPGEPTRITTLPVEALSVDPERFQYKRYMGRGGVGSKLSEVKKYKPELGGIIAVWKDPDDGKTYVVNGHHRFELATRAGYPEIAVRYLDADSAGEAKTIGALINIAEGQGSPEDAAVVFRKSGITPDKLQQDYGVSIKGNIAKQGLGLSQLDGSIFKKVETGGIPRAWGVTIGEKLPDYESQKALVEILEKKSKRRKNISASFIEQLINDVAGVETKTEVQTSLFGDEIKIRPLLMERAELRDYAIKTLSTDKRLFDVVGDPSKGKRLQQEGNVLDLERNKMISENAGEIADIINRLAGHKGPISDALNQYAKELADAKSTGKKNDIKTSFLQAARRAAESELKKPSRQVSEAVIRYGTGREPDTGIRRETAEPLDLFGKKTPAQQTIFGGKDAAKPKRPKRKQGTKQPPRQAQRGLFTAPTEAIQPELFPPFAEKRKPKFKPAPVPGGLQATRKTRMVTTGYIGHDGLVAKDTAHVASLLAHIRKSAQEYAYTVTTNKNGTILEIHKYSKGAKDSADINPIEIAGRTLNIPGAATVYFAHNHPAGDPMPSNEDIAASDKIGDILKSGDIKLESFVIGSTKFTTILDESYRGAKIPPILRKVKLPVKERGIAGKASTEAISSHVKANEAINRHGNKDGILFLDTKLKEVGFLPWPAGKSMKEATKDIIAAAEKTNASTYILNSNTSIMGTPRGKYIDHLVANLKDLNLSPVDIIEKGISFSDTDYMPHVGAGQADFSKLLSKDVLYSTQTKPPASTITAKAIRSMPIAKSWKLTEKDGKVYVRTRGQHGFTIEGVDSITPNEIAFSAGYKRAKRTSEAIAGAYKHDNRKISIVKGVGDKWTVGHEFVHFLERSGILTRMDTDILKAEIRRLTRKGEFTPESKTDIGGEEDRAKFIEQVLYDRAQKGFIRNVMKKIADAIGNFVNLFKRTSRGVIRNIESGKIMDQQAEGVNEFAQPVTLSVKQAAKNIMDNPKFRKWFGDSKVVDEDGKPMVVYHGGAGGIGEFKAEKIQIGGGFYFTPNKRDAEEYKSRAEGGQIYSVYLSLKNPLLIDTEEGGKIHDEIMDEIDDKMFNGENIDGALAEIMNKRGFDGFMETNGEEICIFNPNQIKSIYNRGTFSADNPDIMYSAKDDVEMETVYHTSPVEIKKINKDGHFGDVLFFSRNEYTMTNPMNYHTYALDITNSKILDVNRVFYEYDPEETPKLQAIIERVMDVVEVDQEEAQDLLDESIDVSELRRYAEDEGYGVDFEEVAKLSWWVQAQQGHMAKALGYDMAAGTDEQGEVFIVPMTGREKDLTLEAITKDGERTEIKPEQNIQYSVRTKPAPKKTAKAYKLFKVKKKHPGKLFPLFVGANDPVEIGTWLDAEVGPMTDKGKVKSKLGPLAFRPGWHAGDMPVATHIGEGGTPPQYRPEDQVWAEIEVADDVDWQSKANSRARKTKAGKIIPRTAHITDQVPIDGHYRYKTNPNMTGSWIITGAIKVNRILSDAEVSEINKKTGTTDLPRKDGAEFNFEKYGFSKDIEEHIQYSTRLGKALDDERMKPDKSFWNFIKTAVIDSADRYKPQKTDFSPASKLLSPPLHHFDKIEAAGRMYKHTTGSQADFYLKTDEMFSDGEGGSYFGDMEVLAKSNPKEFKKLNKRWVDDDMEGRGYRIGYSKGKWRVFDQKKKQVAEHETEAEAHLFRRQKELEDLQAEGFSEDAMKVHAGKNEILDRGFEALMRPMREMIVKAKGTLREKHLGVKLAANGKWQVYNTVDGKFQGGGFDSEAEAWDSVLDIPAVIEEDKTTGQRRVGFNVALAQMGDLRGHYFPRVRKSGAYVLTATKKGANTERHHFDVPAGVKIGKRSLNLPSTMQIKTRRLEAKGYKVTWAKSEAMPESVFDLVGQRLGFFEMISKAIEGVGMDAITSFKDMGLQGKWTDKGEDRNFVLTGESAYRERYIDIFREFGGKVRYVERHIPAGKIGYSEWTFKNADGDIEKKIAQRIFEVESINPDFVAEFQTEIARNISNIFKARGARSHMIQRSEATGKDVVIGYETDALQAIGKYIRGIAAGESKRDLAISLVKDFTGTWETWTEYKERIGEGAEWNDYKDLCNERRIDPTRQKNAHNECLTYMKDVLRNQEQTDRIVGTMAGAAVLKYLAFRVAAPLVNLTALPTALVGTMHGIAKVPITKAFSNITRAIKLYSTYRWGDKEKLPADIKRLFEDIDKKGWLVAQYDREALIVLQSKAGRGYNKLIDKGMLMFSVTEQINRAASIAGTYLSVRGRMGHDEALELSKEVSDKANGEYGKANRMHWVRGGGLAANAALCFMVFKTFSVNYINTMVSLGFNEKDVKGAMWMLLSPAVLAGAGASVATPLLALVAKAIGMGDDPEEEFYAKLEEHMGSYGEQIGRYGLLGAADINIKSSLAIGIGDFAIDKPADIFGAPGSVISDIGRGVSNLFRGNIAKGFEQVLPSAAGSIIKSVRESTEGVTSRTGTPIFYGDEQLKATGLDAMLRFFSFNPARMAGIREKQWSERKLKIHYQKMRGDITARLKKWYLGRRSKVARIDIESDIKAYNQRIKENGLTAKGIPLYTKKQIRSAQRRVLTAPKRERERFK